MICAVRSVSVLQDSEIPLCYCGGTDFQRNKSHLQSDVEIAKLKRKMADDDSE